MGRFAQLLAQFTGPLVSVLDFMGAIAFGALHGRAEREPQLQFMLETFVSLGQATENSQSRRKMFDCFARRTAAQRIARGLFAILQRPLEIAALLEMTRQFRRYLICTISVRRFLAHPDADCAIRNGAPRSAARKPLRDTMRAESGSAPRRCRQAIRRRPRPAETTFCSANAAHRSSTSVKRRIRAGRDRRRRKLHARDAGNFEQPLRIGLEPGELLRDHLGDVAGHDSIGLVDQVLQRRAFLRLVGSAA